MIIKCYPSGPFDTNAYVVVCPETKRSMIIDPGLDSYEPIKNHIENNAYEPLCIILTHSHWDHIGNVFYLKNHFNTPVWIHKADSENLQTPGSDGIPCWEKIEGVSADKFLTDGDSFSIGNLHFNVIHTPGHSPGGICLYCEKEHILFSGDTLFKGSIGNLSFPKSNSDAMWDSLKKLSKLPKSTQVYPGHGADTTIGSETWLSKAKEIFHKY